MIMMDHDGHVNAFMSMYLYGLLLLLLLQVSVSVPMPSLCSVCPSAIHPAVARRTTRSSMWGK